VELRFGLGVEIWKALDLRDLVAAGGSLVGRERSPAFLLRVNQPL
jgi:hypothetical protein